MRALPSPTEAVERGSDTPAFLTEALRRLDDIEWPRRASQVEPAPFPADALVVDLAWQPVIPAAAGQADVPPVSPPCGELFAGIARQAFGADIEWLHERLSTLLDGTALHWDVGTVATLVDEAYTAPMERLWARAWAAAFNQLKLEGHLPLDARVSELTNAQCARVSSAARGRYPRLGERTAAIRDALFDEMHALCLRLTADVGELAIRWCAGELPQVVTRVVPLGDRHRSGWVGRVQLSDAAHSRTWDTVYKPRSLRVDQAFYDMATALAQAGDPTVEAPWFLDRGAYGWMEYCAPRDCTSVAEAEAYYERLGWLTAVVFALEGRDCHAGNVVARGASPVFVDLECLFTPSADPDAQDPRYPPITATALLPMTRFALGEFGGMDVSGFGGGQSGSHYYQTWRIDETAAGTLTLRRERRPLPRANNVPRIGGTPVNPYGYCAPFLRGMGRAFARLQSVGSRLLAFTETAHLNDLETRVVLRNTSEYVKCLDESTAPCAALPGDAEDKFFETALKPVSGVDPVDERECLRRGSIPRHGVTHVAGDVQRARGANRSYTPTERPGDSGLGRVRTLLDTGLAPATVTAQLLLAEQACAAGARNANAVAFASPDTRSPVALHSLLERVIACIDARRADGALDWITATSSRGGALVLTRMQWGGLTGRAGVLAAYAAAAAKGVECTQRALVQFHRVAESDAAAIAASLPPEGLDGCASVLACTVGGGLALRADRLHDELLARLLAVPKSSGFGPVPAGTLMGLTAAFEMDPTPDLAELIHARLHAFVHSVELARLIDREFAPVSVKWASPWAMVLASARAARALSDKPARVRLSHAIGAGDLTADTVHDRLFRLRLMLDAGDESTASTLGHEIVQLRNAVSAMTLGSQYGLGALLGVAFCARERKAIDDAFIEEIISAYVAGTQVWLDACEGSILNRPLFIDVARGVAGIVLRLTQAHARKPLPSAFVF